MRVIHNDDLDDELLRLSDKGRLTDNDATGVGFVTLISFVTLCSISLGMCLLLDVTARVGFGVSLIAVPLLTIGCFCFTMLAVRASNRVAREKIERLEQLEKERTEC